MLSINRAYQVVIRCIRAIAGRAEPEAQHTLEESGISTDLQLGLLKNEITAELAKEGFEFQKMGLDDIKPTSTVKDVAQLVSYAQEKRERLY
jgi:hypothetical protein